MATKTEIQEFSLMIEEIVSVTGMSYMDALVEHCKCTGLEEALVGGLISANLKAKLYAEAQDLNLLKKSSTISKFL